MNKLATHHVPNVNFRRVARIIDNVFQELDRRHRAYAPLANEVAGAYGTDVGAALEDVFKTLCQLVDAHATVQSNRSATAKDAELLAAEKSQARSVAKLVRAHKKLMKLRNVNKR